MKDHPEDGRTDGRTDCVTEIKVSGESWEKGQMLSSVVDCNQCPSLICHLLRHHAVTRKNVCGAEVQHDETFSRWKQSERHS